MKPWDLQHENEVPCLKELMKVFKALADTTRVRIIKILQKKSLCVSELQEILEIAQSSVSRHLKILEDAGLVEHEKCGMRVNYQLITRDENPYASAMLYHLDSWLENNSHIQRDREHTEQGTCETGTCGTGNV